MGPFKMEHRSDEHLLVVTGEVDAASAPALAQAGVAAVQAADSALDLDLEGVSFLDSTGLRALLTVNEAAEAAGVRLTLVHASRPVLHLLELTKLDGFFAVAG